MIESIRESVVYMAHTHDGARVAMHCLWHGTAKVWTHTHTHALSQFILHPVKKSNTLMHIYVLCCHTELTKKYLIISIISVIKLQNRQHVMIYD